MAEFQNAALQDRAIEREEDDALDRLPFIDSLVRALVQDEVDENGELIARHSRGYVVGLTGSWGLGKSSILNLLHSRLASMDRVIVVFFNPWLFNGRDELVRGFFSELRDAMGRSNIEAARDAVTALDKYWGAIDLAAHATAAFVDLHGAAGVATTGWVKWKDRIRAVINRPTERSPQQERRSLEDKLKHSNAAIIVLIDELDRVEDDEVRAVAQLVKAVGDIKGISYLVAYDPQRVTEALGRGDARRGEAYLEKIIQHPVPLRPLFGHDVELLIDAALKANDLHLGEADEKYKEEIRSTLVRLIQTPRDVKRLIGAFSVLEAAVRGEICRFDILGYAWIATKAPNLRARIAVDLDEVVDDPSDGGLVDLMLRRIDATKEPNVRQALGEDAASMEALLKLLFPKFTNSHAKQTNRIAHRRNLIRLLYLGNPPDMIAGTEVTRVWSLPTISAMESELAGLSASGRLRAFLDRLDDMIAELDVSQDTIFWPALARLLPRTTDWIDSPDERRAVADDAMTILIRLVLRNRKQSPRLATVMDALISHGDLVLAPALLRKHLFAYGLTKHSLSSREESALSREETLALIEREIPRYRAAILEGTALRRLPNVEAIFVIANLNRWDDELKMQLTDQLQGGAALSTFAALIVPPGYVVDQSTLDEISDAATIAERIDALRADGWPDNEYLVGCLRRLYAAAKGRDIAFDEDEEVSEPM